MLRVIHVASGREWRGGERQVLLLARGLKREPDLDQLVLTARGGELERRLQWEGIPVHGVPWTIGLDPRALYSLLRLSRHSHPILHAHDGHALALSAVAARCTGAHLIATRRVDFHLQRPWPWRQAEWVIAVSQAVQAVLLVDGIAAKRVRVVPSGIDVDATSAVTPVDIRKILGLPPHSAVAVNVAALVGHKDHRTLIAAAAVLGPRFPELHWIVAGAGPLRARLLRDVATVGMNGRIHLLGVVADPIPLIAAADVFVMSSREEGLGTSVLDALALGVPVVATRAGGLPELLGQEAGLLCPIEDPSALAGAVAQVLAEPEVARRLRSAGPARARQFSYQRMATELVSVYRSFTQMLESK